MYNIIIIFRLLNRLTIKVSFTVSMFIFLVMLCNTIKKISPTEGYSLFIDFSKTFKNQLISVMHSSCILSNLPIFSFSSSFLSCLNSLKSSTRSSTLFFLSGNFFFFDFTMEGSSRSLPVKLEFSSLLTASLLRLTGPSRLLHKVLVGWRPLARLFRDVHHKSCISLGHFR